MSGDWIGWFLRLLDLLVPLWMGCSAATSRTNCRGTIVPGLGPWARQRHWHRPDPWARLGGRWRLEVALGGMVPHGGRCALWCWLSRYRALAMRRETRASARARVPVPGGAAESDGRGRSRGAKRAFKSNGMSPWLSRAEAWPRLVAAPAPPCAAKGGFGRPRLPPS